MGTFGGKFSPHVCHESHKTQLHVTPQKRGPSRRAFLAYRVDSTAGFLSTCYKKSAAVRQLLGFDDIGLTALLDTSKSNTSWLALFLEVTFRFTF